MEFMELDDAQVAILLPRKIENQDATVGRVFLFSWYSCLGMHVCWMCLGSSRGQKLFCAEMMKFCPSTLIHGDTFSICTCLRWCGWFRNLFLSKRNRKGIIDTWELEECIAASFGDGIFSINCDVSLGRGSACALVCHMKIN